MNVVLRAGAAYVILLFAFRLVGRRSTSNLAPFDLIVLFMLAGSMIGAVIGDDHSMVAAVSAISTIGLMHISVSWLKVRSDRFGRLVDGTPVVVFEHGEWHEHRMARLRIEKTDVMAAARGRGLLGINQVRYAVVERSGTISIIEEEN